MCVVSFAILNSSTVQDQHKLRTSCLQLNSFILIDPNDNLIIGLNLQIETRLQTNTW